MPIITKIKQQKKNKNRYSIYIDKSFAFGVHEDLIVKFGLTKNMEIEKSFIDEVLKEKEQKKANNYGLKLLSYRARSEKEIRVKMINKGYEKFIIDKTIGYLKKYNYIDDIEFAYNFTKDRMKNKKIGEKRIKLELKQKGIDKEIINKVLGELIENEDEYKRAYDIAEKKFKSSYKNDDKRAQYRKLGGYLQRRGYSYEIVSKVLNNIINRVN